MKAYAEYRGGNCLSKLYVNAHKPLDFVCRLGHLFPLNANKIRTEETWCRLCSHKETADKLRGSLGEMQALAEDRGGKCLSDIYLNARTELVWQCAKGHPPWTATPDSIKNRESWCPHCQININEEKCRFILQTFTGKSFPKNRQVFNQLYEMDGYNDELKIGFEYHGRQHYEYIKHWHANKSDLELRKETDKIKESLCIENGIKLIIIPYFVNSEKEKIALIQRELLKYGIKLITNTINMEDFRFNDQMLERYAKIAESNGGNCLSNIFEDAHTPLEWECINGHCFSMSPTNIQSGRWCPYCKIGTVRGPYKPLSQHNLELAAEWHPTKNGIQSPDNFLVTSAETVWWLGKCGHEWAEEIKARHYGKKCPKCNFRNVTNEKSLAIKAPQLAQEWHPYKNGVLTPYGVTPGMRKKVWWKCLECGNEWDDYLFNRSDVPARKGRGCRKCRDKKKQDLKNTKS
ncbi:hypothetical protein A8708_31330 [Paenibacillus oryzisoli]|uniref:Treble clef zinc finger domain-containing protein n=2 Tax=Paenibacillus oryzisoli TaxID=1850517 RepID=A0A198AJF7_9BACL|nr:hypothetical protein A8708_31330 [Paenibacillus oryzisoli]